MSNIDSMISEVMNEITSTNESNEQLQEVLNAYNTNVYGIAEGQKLKMIAWDRQ